MGAARLFRAFGGRRATGLLRPAAAAQCDRHPAHGARVSADADGHAGALPPHARIQYQLGGRHRPCRHRDPDRGRTPDAGRRQDPPRPRPRQIPRARMGMETTIRLDHHPTDATPGRLGQLDLCRYRWPARRLLHHGRENVTRRGRGVRAHARRRPHLPRQAPGQLGPGARHRGVRPRGRQRRGRRQDLGNPLSARRRHGRGDGRHHPSGNHARRRRHRRKPHRRALRAAGRKTGITAPRRPHDSGNRRRLRRSGVRHRLRQDHAGARFQRLPDRAAPWTGADQCLDPGRQDQRQRPGGLPWA